MAGIGTNKSDLVQGSLPSINSAGEWPVMGCWAIQYENRIQATRDVTHW